jgi:propanediol dehydratase large subunit
MGVIMLYLHFDESGRFVGKTSEPGDGHYSFKVGKGKELGERFSVVDGKLVDNFPGKTDEEVLSILAEQAAKAVEAAAEPAKPTQRPITKLAFMERFTDEELAAIYAAAKTDVRVEVWLDKLKLASEVDLNDPRTIAGVQALAAAGLLSEARVQEVLA